MINPHPFQVGRRKFGELWSTNKKVLVAHIDQPKWIFFWRLHIDTTEVLVHCKLTQVHTPRGSRIQFLESFNCQLPFHREKFRLPKLTFHSDLRRRTASRLALPCTSSLSFSTYTASLDNLLPVTQLQSLQSLYNSACTL